MHKDIAHRDTAQEGRVHEGRVLEGRVQEGRVHEGRAHELARDKGQPPLKLGKKEQNHCVHTWMVF